MMPILERGKKIVEKITGWQRPSSNDLDRLVRSRKANTFRFKDDGIVPNHPHWPLIVYRGAVKLSAEVRSGRNLRRSLRTQWLARLLAKRHLRLCALPLPHP